MTSTGWQWPDTVILTVCATALAVIAGAQIAQLARSSVAQPRACSCACVDGFGP